MGIEKFQKQPYEEFVIGADFSSNFESGTTILTQTVTAIDKVGNDVSASVLDQASIVNDGTAIVNVLVRAGEDDKLIQPYKISFRIIDSTQQKWELDVSMNVKEL